MVLMPILLKYWHFGMLLVYSSLKIICANERMKDQIVHNSINAEVYTSVMALIYIYWWPGLHISVNWLHQSCLDNKHIKGTSILLPAFLVWWYVIILHCIRSVSNFYWTAISEKQLSVFVSYLQLCGRLEFSFTFDRNEFQTQLLYYA